MADECEYLEYRPLLDDSGDGDGGDAGTGDEPEDHQSRAYCTAADQFVQAMRADVCNRRYGLDPETDCEIYREAEGLPVVSKGEGSKNRDVGTDNAEDIQTDAEDARTDAGGD